MRKLNSAKVYYILFAVIAILYFALTLINNNSMIVLFDLIMLIGLIGIISSNDFKDNILLLFFPVILFIISLIYSVQHFIGVFKGLHSYSYISFMSILSVLTYLSLLILVISSYRKSPLLDKIWFLPWSFYFINFIINVWTIEPTVIHYYYLYFSHELLWVILLFITTDILRNSYQYKASFNSYSKNNISGKVSDLLILKELYDDGVITKEEFEEKKKENLKLK